MTIADIQNEYRGNIDTLDLEVLLAHTLDKPREFILTHPEHRLKLLDVFRFKKYANQRMKGKPMAYILGHKEFYGLDFLVNKHTLIPRPETELMVELLMKNINDTCNLPTGQAGMIHDTCIVDVGTGSGCIITSVAKTIGERKTNDTPYRYFGVDISEDALKIARKNARINGVAENIPFLHSDLLSVFMQNENYELRNTDLLILANLPYLSDEIFASAPIDVRNYEPKTALYSASDGLAHYEKLLGQLKSIYATCCLLPVTCLLEFSPEQKMPLQKLVKSIFPQAKITFHKDLAGKWRVVHITVR